MSALEKALLIELDADFKAEKPGGKRVPVQFNPETLKVTFANQLVQPQGGDQAAGSSGRQLVGAGTTKLALSLWFDVTAMTEDPVDDVRRLTQKLIDFITPQPDPADAKKLVPPATRFVWGSFLFDGIVEGLEETLEFFAPDGKPLRAAISLTLGQQKILVSTFTGDGRVPSTPGQAPLSQAKAGDTLQGLAGPGGDWKALATANGIEDPLRLAPGQMINASASVSASASISFGGSAAVAPPVIKPPALRGGARLSVNGG